MSDVNFKSSVTAKSSVKGTFFEEEAKKFLECLFEKDDIIEFRLIPQNRKLNVFKFWNKLETATNDEFLESLREKNNSKYHIYYGVNPRIEENKSGDDSVKLCRWFFIDADPDDYPHVPPGKLYNFIESKIEDLCFAAPTLVVNSGHGYHFYWKIDRAITPEEWEKIQAGLIIMFGSDPKCKNPERLLRVPGFFNPKYEKIKKCKIVKIELGNTYSYEYFKSNVDIIEKRQKELDDIQSMFNFQLVDVVSLIKERKWNWQKQNKENIYVECSFAEDFHKSGKDTSPSCSLGIAGVHKGIYNCFECDEDKVGGKTSGHLLSLLLRRDLGQDFFNEKKCGEALQALIKDLNEKFPGFYSPLRGKTIYRLGYPEKIAAKILKKYFTIPAGQPEAGGISFYYCDGGFYYGYKGRYIPAKTEYLNSLIWHELKNAWASRKNSKKSLDLVPFPASQAIVDNVIKAMIGIRNIRYLIIKNGSYEREEEIGNIFWINNRPELPDAKDLIVVKNKIINYRTGESYNLTLNLFCLSPLNVNYDESLPQPKRCDQFLKDNFETEPQINEVLKRDAYLCLPEYLTNTPAFFVMKGKTGSGKGTNIEFLREILGRSNWEEASFLALGELFGLEKLIGILVAFISDMEDEALTRAQKGLAMERAKKMSSGIDWLDIRLVGGKWISVKLPTKLVFATPIMPKFPKSVSEFIRRMQITVYKKQYNFDKDKCPNALDPDENCLKDMIKEKDAYFTHRIIKQGLKMLLEKGFKSTEEAKQNMQEIREDSNPFEDFFNQCTKENKDSRIMNDVLLQVCILWGKETNRLRKWEIEELTFASITKGIRRDVDIETDKDKKTHKSYLCNRELTDYGKQLLECGGNAFC